MTVKILVDQQWKLHHDYAVNTNFYYIYEKMFMHFNLNKKYVA